MSTLVRNTVLAVCTLFAGSASAASGDWPQLGFDAHGRRENTQESVLTRKTVAQLAPKWSAAIPANSAPVIANGIAYLGGSDQKLHALDAATGTELWSVATGGAIFSSPAVDGGTVYVGGGARLYAFDAEHGALRWSVIAGNRGIVSSPTVRAGTVFFGNSDGQVYAVNAKTGVVRWTATNIYRGEVATPAVGKGLVYFSDGNGKLDAYHIDTGALAWEADTYGGTSQNAPAVDGGTVYLPTKRTLYAFDAATGATRWTAGLGDIDASIAVAKGHIYLATVDQVIWNFEAATGALDSATWVQKSMESTPAIANGVVYVGSIVNTISAYDSRNSALLWQAATAGSVFAPPTVSHGLLYVVDGHTLTAYGLE